MSLFLLGCEEELTAPEGSSDTVALVWMYKGPTFIDNYDGGYDGYDYNFFPCDTINSVPLYLDNISVNISKVSKSRSFVGSSRINPVLGFAKILAKSNLFCSPPDNVCIVWLTFLGSKLKSLI